MGEPPRWNEDSAPWVERATKPRIDAAPRVIEATAQQQAAVKTARTALRPDDLPRQRVYARIFGADTVAKNRAVYLDARPHANAENQTRAAAQAAGEAAERALAEHCQLHSESRARDSGPTLGW